MKTTAAKTEPSHSLVFMGVGPVETFRCRIYWAPEPEPMTKVEARAWLLSETAKDPDGVCISGNDEAWAGLVDEMSEEGLVHWYRGRVYAGADYKRPEEK